jgi:hypothetical protein
MVRSMLNARFYERIIAEKPDGFKKFPYSSITKSQIEELKKIPRLVVGAVSGVDSMVVLHESLKHVKVDAVMLVSAYTGTGYGERKSLWKNLHALKRSIEKTYNVYCTTPVVIGAPAFWGALNGRYMQELLAKFKFYCPCYGCQLYLYALNVPLCRELNINTVLSGRISRDGDGTPLHQTNTIIHYSATLLSSFGIKLIYNIIDQDTDTELKNTMTINIKEPHDDCYPCLFQKNYLLLNGTCKKPSNLNHYFERFLIPGVAKVISKVLSGRDFEYSNEVEDALLPGIKKNKKK